MIGVSKLKSDVKRKSIPSNFKCFYKYEVDSVLFGSVNVTTCYSGIILDPYCAQQSHPLSFYTTLKALFLLISLRVCPLLGPLVLFFKLFCPFLLLFENTHLPPWIKYWIHYWKCHLARTFWHVNLDKGLIDTKYSYCAFFDR